MPKGTCSVEECERPKYARGWCDAHYERWQKTGDIRPDVPIESRQKRKGLTCKVRECTRPVIARGLCVGHVRRMDKFGDTLESKPLMRPRTGCAVDECNNPHAAKGWCDVHYGPYRRYKLTPEQYSAKLAEQGGGCAICGIFETPMHVDHDHACCNLKKKSCGKCVRGLLCSRCNLALGYVRENLMIVKALDEYLHKWAHDQLWR